MQALSEKRWNVFRLEDEFDCTKGVYLPTGKVVDGRDTFVTAKSGNNGVSRFIGNGTLFDGNRITIEKIKLSAYYQPASFYCSHDVSVISNDEINKNNGQFIAEMIMRNGLKYSYGRQAQLNVVKREKIMLPAGDDDKPDYAFMSSYAEAVRGGLLMRYKSFLDGRISDLKHMDIPALDEKEWAEFHIGSLFEVSRPKPRNKDTYTEGAIPFVASGSVNNGVMKLCKPTEQEKLDPGGCITVSPVDGSTFYQPIDFLGRGGAGSSILILRADWLNLYNGQVVARLIKQTCSKYTYGHMGNKDGIKREIVMLPIKANGEPDYAYMEQYAMNMMLHKYKQYLAFLDHKKE